MSKGAKTNKEKFHKNKLKILLKYDFSHYSDGGTLQWENGRSERINRGDDRAGGFWSSGGRSGPQPETGGECLAILNNVYNDGIKWHDVACSHTKPTICEE